MIECKTRTGQRKNMAHANAKRITNISHIDSQVNIINNHIKNELSDLDFFNFIDKFDPHMDAVRGCKKLLSYLVKKSCTQTLDILAKKYKYDIIDGILKYTDDIYMYIKYCTDADRIADRAGDYCVSLFYENEPSKLSDYIINNYECSLLHKFFLYVAIKHMDHDETYFEKNYLIITHIIKQFCLTADINNIHENFFDLVSEDNFMPIIKLLFENINDSNKINFNRSILNILFNCSFNNIKLFIAEYGDYVNFKLLLKEVINFDIFLYLVEFVGLENIDIEFFMNNFRNNSCEIIKWLIEHGFKIRPTISCLSHFDTDTIIEIIKHAISDDDCDYIYDNTEIIIKIIFSSNSLNKILEIANIEIFNLNTLFEIIMIDQDFNLWYQLFPAGAKINNVDDVINDLKLLNMYDTVKYIEEHSNLFY